MSKIEDWDAVLRHPGFWYQYFGRLDDDDDHGSAGLGEVLFGPHAGFDYEALNGPDEDDSEEDEDEVTGSVLALRFPHGYRWEISFSPESTVHSLTHERMPRSLLLGFDDGHFQLPILRWAEVFALAARPVHLDGHPDTPIRSSVLVALLSAVTYATTEREVAHARHGLAQALGTAAITTPGNADEAARRLVGLIDNLGWRPDPALGWINDGPHSRRNPTNGDWTPADFWRFGQFVSGARGGGDAAGSGDRAPAWQIAAGGPVGPSLTASDDTVLFTTWPGTLHAVEARSGRPLWRVPVPEPGFGHGAPVLAGDTVYYAGGRRSIDLICLPRWGSGDREATFTVTLDEAESRFSTSPAYLGRVDTTPVVAGKTVLVAGDALHARWLGPTGPQAHWDTRTRGMFEIQSAPAVDDRAVFVVVCSRFQGLLVLAFDLATGAQLWRAQVPGVAVNRPAVEGGELFVAGRSLVAVDPGTGVELWSVPTGREYTGAIAATATHVVGATGRLARPVPDDDRPEWCFTVVCVDRRTRAVAWTFTAETRMTSSGVTITDGVVYSVGHDDRGGTLYALDLATGRLSWQAEVGRSSALAAVAGGMVYVSNMEGKVTAFPAGRSVELFG